MISPSSDVGRIMTFCLYQWVTVTHLLQAPAQAAGLPLHVLRGLRACGQRKKDRRGRSSCNTTSSNDWGMKKSSHATLSVTTPIWQCARAIERVGSLVHFRGGRAHPPLQSLLRQFQHVVCIAQGDMKRVPCNLSKRPVFTPWPHSYPRALDGVDCGGRPICTWRIAISRTNLGLRCEECGGRFGLIVYRYFARRFCTKVCKAHFLAQLRQRARGPARQGPLVRLSLRHHIGETTRRSARDW